jgi:hypothetical protein
MKKHQGKLTRRFSSLLFYPCLISSGGFAQCFVACGKEDNRNEGEEEGREIANVPPPEDDTEVFSVPREEHLWLS